MINIKRVKRVRSKISGTNKKPRLTVYRSNKYIYGQLIDDVNGKTLASYSSSKLTKAESKGKSKIEVAKMSGEKLAGIAKKMKIASLVFDRGGYKYHGRVKAFADGAREGGLKF
jgi:large subunit ribosomal protein L18